MLGTELNSAYAPFGSDFTQERQDFDMIQSHPQQPQQQSQSLSHEISHKSTPIAQLSQPDRPQLQPLQQLQQLPQHLPPSASHTSQQDPRIAILVNELRKQQRLTASIQQQSSYLDKLFSRKKDLLKITQLSLIVVLALSVHFLVDNYLKNYIKSNDFTFERELIIRLLYPLSVLFILWNLKTFVR